MQSFGLMLALGLLGTGALLNLVVLAYVVLHVVQVYAPRRKRGEALHAQTLLTAPR